MSADMPNLGKCICAHSMSDAACISIFGLGGTPQFPGALAFLDPS